MQKRRVIAVLIAVFILTSAGIDPPPVSAQESAKPATWQYSVYFHSDLMALGGKTVHANLNKLGEQGWELVAVVPGITGANGSVSRQTTFFFKRAKK